MNRIGRKFFLFRYAHKEFENGHIGLMEYSKTLPGNIGMFIAINNDMSMFKNHLKWVEETWLNKKPSLSSTSLGLAVGIAWTILITLWVQDELS
jgi:hypothetical protein